MTSLPKEIQKTQKLFNSYIRERDKNQTCISCGKAVEQAGHYFPAGHYTGMRFEETNTHGQCVQCNYFKSGNLVAYRQGLVNRYGSAYVEALENKAPFNKRKKWTRFELELIRIDIKNKLAQLKN